MVTPSHHKLSWWPLVRDITRRARAKIWSLLKLREAGADQDQLLDLYIARVRNTCEYGAQVFHCLLNASQEEDLEGVQRKCVQIILGCKSKSYSENLATLELETLACRREELVKTFAIKCFQTVEHPWWFTPHPPPPLPTRHAPPRFLVPSCKLERDMRRPIVKYSMVLNELTDEE